MSQATPLSLAEIARTLNEGVPLAAAWGVEVLAAADGQATLRLPRREELLRPGGTVSGPALMGLADMGVWAALLSVGLGASVTSNLNATFMRAAGPGPVVAECRLVKRGRRMSFAEVWITAEGAEAPAMHCTMAYVGIG